MKIQVDGTKPSKGNIIVVERNKRNLELLSDFLIKLGFETVPVDKLEELNKTLLSNQTYQMALIDVDGFDESIWNYCKRISEKEIQFLIIFPKQSSELKSLSFKHGASSVLSKPLVMKELANLIINLSENN